MQGRVLGLWGPRRRVGWTRVVMRRIGVLVAGEVLGEQDGRLGIVVGFVVAVTVAATATATVKVTEIVVLLPVMPGQAVGVQVLRLETVTAAAAAAGPEDLVGHQQAAKSSVAGRMMLVQAARLVIQIEQGHPGSVFVSEPGRPRN